MTARKRPAHRVACLVADGIDSFELGTVSEVFATVHPDLDAPWWYSLTLCAETPGPCRTAGGFDIAVSAGLEALRRAETIVVPSTVYDVESDARPLVAKELR